VIVGETSNYAFDAIQKAVNLVLKGAKLIGTNPDITARTNRASRRPAKRWSPRSSW
jgi:ribonucleotide monophosphatase NagD (HAD superfamily)